MPQHSDLDRAWETWHSNLFAVGDARGGFLYVRIGVAERQPVAAFALFRTAEAALAAGNGEGDLAVPMTVEEAGRRAKATGQFGVAIIGPDGMPEDVIPTGGPAFTAD